MNGDVLNEGTEHLDNSWDISVETDVDVPTDYICLPRPRQEEPKVEFTLDSHIRAEGAMGVVEVVEALERENMKMERDIRRLERKGERIESENRILKESLSDMLLRDPR